MPRTQLSQEEHGSLVVDEPAVGVGGVTSISVIMPAYNEAANLVEVVPRTLDVLDARSRRYHEVVVVDDGSTRRHGGGSWPSSARAIRERAAACACGATSASRPRCRPASTARAAT